ncbi:MAG: type II secretion system protein [Kiritimatiellae bacterium]|nr:type II secretion system protein [Kiritimatiellia bacterium]MCO6400772.1 type II secretion system protein [Verrucomicrobiota bacterium]
MNKDRTMRERGFTLIELLVVIAIIGILASILTPALRSSIDKAKQARVQTELQSIKTAISAYMNDYSKLPVANADQGKPDQLYQDDESKGIIRVLTANETANPMLNPRKIVYLEATASQTDGTFADVWGTQYSIALDNNYDGKIDDITTVSVVMSAGPDRNFSTTNDNLQTIQ